MHMLLLQGGPRASWSELTHSQRCTGAACDAFKSQAPSTVSMTVLVVVEMFNALNALSENGSLLHLPPWSNRWLIAAIALSMLLHAFILYVPPAAVLFSVVPLGAKEWRAVVLLSAPVVLVDELLKCVSRCAAASCPCILCGFIGNCHHPWMQIQA